MRLSGVIVHRSFTVAALIGLFTRPACAQPAYDFILVDSLNANPLAGETLLWGINDHGVVCGTTTIDNVIGYPGIVWDEITRHTRVPVSNPQAVNNNGLVVGNGSVFDLVTGQLFTPPNLPGTYYGPFFGGVNDAGIAVGTISGCSCSDSGGLTYVPYIWDAVNGARTLPAPVPNARGLNRINNSGVAIGWLNGWTFNDGFFVDINSGAYTYLANVFPSNVGTGPIRASDINDNGEIVGSRAGFFPVYRYGYIYSPSAGVRILPFPGAGYQQSVRPSAVNNAGTIVGDISTEFASSRVFVYTQGTGLRDLSVGALIAGMPAGYRLYTATGINNDGWIVGYGHTAANKITGYVLKPRAIACPADFNHDGTLDFFDYDDFVSCFEGAMCPNGRNADFNADGTVDFFDYDDFVMAFEAGC